jgi:hypothetical protein
MPMHCINDRRYPRRSRTVIYQGVIWMLAGGNHQLTDRNIGWYLLVFSKLVRAPVGLSRSKNVNENAR